MFFIIRAVSSFIDICDSEAFISILAIPLYTFAYGFKEYSYGSNVIQSEYESSKHQLFVIIPFTSILFL